MCTFLAVARFTGLPAEHPFTVPEAGFRRGVFRLRWIFAITTCVLLSALLYQNTIRPLACVKLFAKLFFESHGTIVVCRRIAFRIICSSSFPIATPRGAKVPLPGYAPRIPAQANSYCICFRRKVGTSVSSSYWVMTVPRLM